MPLLKKISSRLTDPVFYRKRLTQLSRSFQSFDDTPRETSLDCLSEVRRVLLVIAHPDDETFCSGLLAALSSRGCEISAVCLTRGEGGPTGGATREELGAIRTREMEEACEVLAIRKVTFLGHVDPVAGQYRVYAPDVSVEQLSSELSPHFDGIDLILSHGSEGEYWHPAHLLVHAAVKKAVSQNTKEEIAWMSFLARDPDHPNPRLVNWGDRVFLRRDSSDEREIRSKAIRCHRSQASLFERFCKGSIDDFLDSTAIESYCLHRSGSLTGRGSD